MPSASTLHAFMRRVFRSPEKAHDEVLVPDARNRALAAQQSPWTQAYVDGSAVLGGDSPPRRVG